MNLKNGTIYEIIDPKSLNFNSADRLKITAHFRNVISFTLGDQQGYGSMPVQHLRYLLKRNFLKEII
ncbi:hypothetical protein [Pseudalkalibacillus berkeleyi]|uniref:Uncharacterized protein n=1 Tax=Pseudalkalibacillus berkeleyi TaxID=1069813 RepID=A0ABS9H0G1_9BACL|nr:hypothetical protein [Pseudalkalibacillus berkeleyi]MCF6137406.1 hypothetical protein [Pseudalkalibacillus berkeleyi]